MARMTPLPAILCCGEAVADLVPALLADGGEGYRMVPGGAAVNTAVALSRMGVPTGFLGALSSDSAGRTLTAHLSDAGVSLSFARTTDRPSTLALAQPLPDGTEFSLFDIGSAGRHYGEAAAMPALPDQTRVLVFGGISLIRPPAANTFEALARREANRRYVWLDLNIRPTLVADPEPYRQRLFRLLALADILKVSDEDLQWLGVENPVHLTVPETALVLHSHGAGGASAYWKGRRITVTAPKVTVQDTVGAGDIFNAGVLTHLWQTDALELQADWDHALLHDAMTLGVAAASISVTRAGANAPTLKEIACAPSFNV